MARPCSDCGLPGKHESADDCAAAIQASGMRKPAARSRDLLQLVLQQQCTKLAKALAIVEKQPEMKAAPRWKVIAAALSHAELDLGYAGSAGAYVERTYAAREVVPREVSSASPETGLVKPQPAWSNQICAWCGRFVRHAADVRQKGRWVPTAHKAPCDSICWNGADRTSAAYLAGRSVHGLKKKCRVCGDVEPRSAEMLERMRARLSLPALPPSVDVATVESKRDRAVDRDCWRCGDLVAHVPMRGPGANQWQAVRHAAKCGLVCVHGPPATVAEIAAGEVHGFEDGCPKCGELPPLGRLTENEIAGARTRYPAPPGEPRRTRRELEPKD